MQVLLITNDNVGRKRAGPGIRCVELAKVLARHFDVALAATQSIDIDIEGVKLIPNTLAHPGRLRAAVSHSDVVIIQGLVLAIFPFLRRAAKFLVVDLYDPYLLEYLLAAHPQFPRWGYLRQWHDLNLQLLRGDYFLCANDRQRDYWLGRLCALGRLTPEECRRDPSFKSLIGMVPFGISSSPPHHTKAVIKGIVPGIAPDDTVLIWGGGIWQWFDPLTVIKALALVSQERSDIKLLFLGTQDPNPNKRATPIASEAEELAKNLGVLNRAVFFKEGWVPFEERQDYFMEADIGVSAHFESYETRLAFRTRILDYIWAGLPMILTEGDCLADWASRQNVGTTLRTGDVEGWKQAILSVAGSIELRQEIRNRLQQLAPQFYWEKLAEPLLDYCRRPYRTDRASGFRMKLVPFLIAGFEHFRQFRNWWR
ncbi:MAG TPA: glycosyltransferase family 4 protein [Terriglobia bacterium]|nr:glycosyltransferase family 4 protein [Terriglobia bacterium]